MQSATELITSNELKQSIAIMIQGRRTFNTMAPGQRVEAVLF
ncbi:hypothetical protein EDO6_03891 [Paenibacillus xylanexedens]|nr:hypothetical protein EDO6_03891 [Paenibacillus xylanexedens]